MRDPHILVYASHSDFKTSCHYLAGVSQSTSADAATTKATTRTFTVPGVATGFGIMNDEPHIIIGEREGWGDPKPFGISARTSASTSTSSEKPALVNQRSYGT